MHASDDATAGGFAQLVELLTAVRRRWRLVALIVVAASAAAFALTVRQTKEYEATSQVLISQANPVSSLLSRTDARPPDPERDFNTRLALIKEPAVAARVRRSLGLTLSVDALLSKISTTATATSDIADITARDPDPGHAAAIANAFATEYLAVRQAAARDRVQDAVALAARQLASLSPAERDSAGGRDLADRLRELQIDAQLQTSGVEVVARARPPAAPSAPRPLLTTALAGFLAGLVGVALAVVLELGDRRLRDESDLEPFGVSLLGAVPQPPARAGDDDFAVREGLATVATNLRFLHDRRDVGAVVLAPADRRDPEATVPVGLSIALVQMGLTVVMIETDMRRPRIAELVGATHMTGLSTVLSGFAELDDVMVPLRPDDEPWPQPSDGEPAAPSCAIVPAGPVVPNPLGLLAGPAMAQVVERAREQADVVLLDCAPVGTVGDALTLAELTDGTVLLADVGGTRLDAFRRAIGVLQDVPTDLMGVVLTNVARRRDADYGAARARRIGGAIRS